MTNKKQRCGSGSGQITLIRKKSGYGSGFDGLLDPDPYKDFRLDPDPYKDLRLDPDPRRYKPNMVLNCLHQPMV